MPNIDTAMPGLERVAARLRVVPGAFVVSRLIVLAAGSAGALIATRVPGWMSIDPARASSGMGSVGNVFAAAAVRWDANAYTGIAAHGYTTKISTTFFPFYPLLIRAVGWALGSYVLAGILISLVAFGVALVLLHRLTELELGSTAADAAVLLLAFAPVSFFFSAIYTESLFLALALGAVYAARQDRIAVASVLAALASVTRVTGVLLVVPIALFALRDGRRPTPRLSWLLLAPAALLGFLGYLASRGYGWLAPSHNQVAHRLAAGPLTTIVLGLRDAGRGVSDLVSGVKPYSPTLVGPFTPHFESIILLVVLVLASCMLVVAFRRLPLAYGVFAVLALLVSIFSETKIQPLLGLDRYALTIFPLWMAAGSWVSERRTVRPLVVIGAVLLAFYAYEFTTWAFIA